MKDRDLDHRARRLHEGHQPLCSRRGLSSRHRPGGGVLDGPTGDIPDIALKWLSALEPAGADASEVAEAIARVVDMPHGARPFRIHIDPSQDGAEVVNGVADRVRAELLRRIGLADLLHPTA